MKDISVRDNSISKIHLGIWGIDFLCGESRGRKKKKLIIPNRSRVSRSNYAESRRTFAPRDTRQTVHYRNFTRPCIYLRSYTRHLLIMQQPSAKMSKRHLRSRKYTEIITMRYITHIVCVRRYRLEWHVTRTADWNDFNLQERTWKRISTPCKLW